MATDEYMSALRGRLDAMIDLSTLGESLDCVRDRAMRDSLRLIAYEAAQIALDHSALRLFVAADVIPDDVTRHDTLHEAINLIGGRPGR